MLNIAPFHSAGVIACLVCLGTRAWSDEWQPKDYLPLTVGNCWVYESSEGSAGAPVTEMWRVMAEERGTFVLEIRQSLLDRTFEERVIASPVGRANLGRPAGNTLSTPPRFFLKVPLVLGAVWRNADGRYEITGTKVLAAVPAGVFRNGLEISFRSRDGQARATSVYEPGVGMIQRDETFTILGSVRSTEARGQGRVSLRLKSWTVHAETGR